MNFLLGDNHVANNGKDSTCFVEGFADNSVCHTHHRAGHFEGRNHTLVGALAGGVDDVNNDNTDKTDDYKQNEVTLDYNSGLVGAAAGLYYFYHTGDKVPPNEFITHDELAEVKSALYSFEPTVNVKEYEKYELTDADDTGNLNPIVLNLGDEKQLIYNGTEVTVSIQSGSEFVEIIDEPKGTIRAKKNGEAKLTVTIGGEKKNLNVKVNLSAIPHDVESIVGIERVDDPINFQKNDNNTWKANVDNLPLYDKYGRRYYYYIKERTDAIGSYYPTSYEDGKTLSESGEPTLMQLTNTKAENNGASMPSAGGEGTRGYYVIGMVIICASGAFMFLRRRRTAK